MKPGFLIVDIEDNASGALDTVLAAAAKRVRVRSVSLDVVALLTHAGALGAITDQRKVVDAAPAGMRVVYVDHRDPPTDADAMEWLRYFVAFGVTRNAVLATAIADIATKSSLTVRRTELLAGLVSTSALDEIATLSGVSRNTAKAQLQHTMRRMREANPNHVFTSSADLLRAIIRELADIE